MSQSTQNIPVVGVNVIQVSTSELQMEERRRELVRARLAAEAKSSITISRQGGGGMSSSAEAPQPTSRNLNRFDRHKDAYSNLDKTLKEIAHETGVSLALQKGKKDKIADVSDDLFKKAEKLMAKLDEKVEDLQSKLSQGQNPALSFKRERLRQLRERLGEDFGAYQSVLHEGEEAAAPATSVSSGESSLKAQAVIEERLWKGMEEIGLIKHPSDRDPEKIAEKIELLKKFVSRLDQEIHQKKEELQKAQELLATTSTANERAQAKKAVETLQTEVNALIEKKAVLQQSIVGAEDLQEKMTGLQTRRDLGLPIDDFAGFDVDSLLVQSSSVKEEGPQAAHGGSPRGRQGRISQASDRHQDGGAIRLGTASVSSDASSGPSPLVAANDFSGTLLSIQSVGYNLRSDARKTDKLIKRLLQAALNGNWEAVKSALIYLDKRASQIVIGMGAQTVKAMTMYEKQMSQVSKSIGQLKGTEPDYSSRLAKFNSEMNMYSQNRMAIANFLRDTMSMREEIANMTHSVLQKDSQISSAISRG